MQLGLCALAIALCLGLPAGIIAALKKNSLLDYVPMSTAMIGICLPTFVMGPLLIMIFSSGLGWFSPIGWYTWGDMVLPSLTLGLY
ncbi:MAG: ABC transporter, partial [Verrucomicrobiales bacterium]|nr:ABC transporter [Verrucomicrobiales bacterium]